LQKKRRHLSEASDRGVFGQSFQRQVVFCSVAVFLLFSLVFLINTLNLKYRALPQVTEDVVNLFFISPTIDKFLFYMSSILIMLFPLVTRRWSKSWKWAVACYSPLLVALVGFCFQMAVVSEVFFWLSSLLCLIWIFFLYDRSIGYSLGRRAGFANIFLYVCTIFVIVEVLGLVYWVLLPFGNMENVGKVFESMAWLGMRLFYAPSLLAPFFVVFALFFWLLIPVRSHILKHVKVLVISFRGRRFNLKECLAVDLNAFGFRFFDSWRRLWLLVAFSACLGFLFGIYAYLPVLGGQQKRIGADMIHYVRWLDAMEVGGWENVIRYAFFNVSDRFLGLLVFYVFSTITGLSSHVVVQFAPLSLAPLTVLATFFLMREAELSRSISALGSLFASFSYLTVVGVFTAFLSNWMASVLILFFSGLFLRALRFNSWFFGVFSSLTLALSLFMHAYTWSVVIAVLVLFAFVLFLKWLRFGLETTKLKMVLAIVVSNLAVGFLRNLVLGSGAVAVQVAGAAQRRFLFQPIRAFFVRWVTVQVAEVALSGLSFNNILCFWPTLNGVLQRGYVGLFTNTLMLVLVFLGVVAILMSVYSRNFSFYLICWTVVSSVSMLFGDEVIQFRLFYNMPLHVLAVLGAVFFDAWLLKRVKGRVGKTLVVVFMLLVVLINVNYALRSMITISTLNYT